MNMMNAMNNMNMMNAMNNMNMMNMMNNANMMNGANMMSMPDNNMQQNQRTFNLLSLLTASLLTSMSIPSP